MNKEKSIEIGHFLGETARRLSFIRTEAAYIKDFAGHFSRYTNDLDGVAKSLAILCEKDVRHPRISKRQRDMMSEIISTVTSMEANEYSRTDCSFGFFEKFNIV